MVVRKAARMARQLGAPVLGVIENMSHVVCPNCGEQIEPFGPSTSLQMARELGVPLLGRLPLDPALALRCDAGEVEAYRADTFEPIVETVAKRLSVLSKGTGFGC